MGHFNPKTKSMHIGCGLFLVRLENISLRCPVNWTLSDKEGIYCAKPSTKIGLGISGFIQEIVPFGHSVILARSSK